MDGCALIVLFVDEPGGLARGAGGPLGPLTGGARGLPLGGGGLPTPPGPAFAICVIVAN